MKRSETGNFKTIMFNQLLKTTCKDFLTNAKQSRSDWIKNPKTFDQATAQMEFTNLYTNFSSAGDWDRADEEQAKIIALTTELTDTKSQIAKLSKGPKPAGVKGVVRKGLEAWRFTYTGNTKTVDDVKYIFCKDRGRKDAEGSGGMYIPSLHNHAEWKATKEEKRTNWKEGRKDSKAAKRKASKIEPELDPAPASSTSTLALAK